MFGAVSGTTPIIPIWMLLPKMYTCYTDKHFLGFTTFMLLCNEYSIKRSTTVNFQGSR